MNLGVTETAVSAYEHVAQRLRAELAAARLAARRAASPTATAEVERLELALAALRADARGCGIGI